MKTEVTAALKTQPAKWYLWSDSSVVLHWLRKIPSTLKVFGPHHVTKILEVSEPEMWRHVRTAANSADCLSRGVTDNDLRTHCLWWHGPEFLSQATVDWPASIDCPDAVSAEC